MAWLTRVLSLVLLVCATAAQAETWNVPGFYSVKIDGWKPSRLAAEATAFACQTCGQRVDIIIGYNAAGPADLSNDNFLLGLYSEAQRRRYMADVADAFKAKGQTFEPLKVQVARIAGVQALQYNAKIAAGTTTTYLSAYSFVHKQRQFLVQMATHDQPPPPETLKMVNAFLSTFTLEQ